ncbi:MAG: ribosome silencing factor [Oscillospiraceae bacterium]|nr:ribosome silencing factor [Oscillospiraceae bacterium]
MLTANEIAAIAVKALDAKMAQDIKLLRTTDVTILADYFIICTAGSEVHLKTLSDELARVLGEQGETLLRVEGARANQWALLDYGSLVVHLFLREAREFYTLERLWSDAEDVDIEPILK